MTYQTHPETRIGHIHLRVVDPDRAIRFYRDRNVKDWPMDENGDLQMHRSALDLDALLAEALP